MHQLRTGIVITLLLSLGACAAPAPTATQVPPTSGVVATSLVEAKPTTSAPTTAVLPQPSATPAPIATDAPTTRPPAAPLASPLPAETPALPTSAFGAADVPLLRPLRTFGNGQATSAAFAPDGTTLAIGTSVGLLLVDLPSLGVRTLNELGAVDVAYNHDGTLIATTSAISDQTALYASADLRLLTTVVGINPAFSPDGRFVATVTQGMTSLWAREGGAALATLDGTNPFFSPTGAFLVTRSEEQDPPLVWVWRGDTGAQLGQLHGRQPTVSPADTLLAVADGENIVFWQLPALGEARRVAISAPPTDLGFSPDGTQLIALTWQQRLRWEVATGTELPPLTGIDQRGEFPSTLLSPDTRTIVDYDGAMCVNSGINLVRADDATVITSNDDATTAVFSRDGAWAALVGASGTVQLVNLATGSTQQLDLPGYGQLAFSADGRSAILGTTGNFSNGGSSQVAVIRIADQSLLGSFAVEGIPNRVAFDREGNPFALMVQGCDGYALHAMVWDAQTNKPRSLWDQQAGIFAYQTDYSPLGQLSAWWDENSKELSIVHADASVVTRTVSTQLSALRFNPTGAQLALGDEAGKISLLETVSGRIVTEVHVGAVVQNLAFSQDGTLLAAASDDGLVSIWRINGPNMLAQVHNTAFSQLATPSIVFTPDNQLVVVGGPNGVEVYDIATNTLLRHIPIPVTNIAIGPAGRLLGILTNGRLELWGSQ